MNRAGGAADAPKRVIEPYGAQARWQLAPCEADLQAQAGAMASQLNRHVRTQRPTADVLRNFHDDELASLQGSLEAYIRRLLSAGLTRSAHRADAKRTGRAHALAGVSVYSLVDLYHHFDNALHETVFQRMSPVPDREAVIQILRQRLFFDLEDQVAYYAEFNEAVTALYSELDEHAMSTENLADLVRGSLAIVGELPGRVNVFFLRMDPLGQLQVEQSFGPESSQYHAAMREGDMPMPRTDARSALGRGPAGRAWRSGQLTAVHAWRKDASMEPWSAVGAELGFRSILAVPLLDGNGRTVALITVCSGTPGYFSVANVYAFFRHLQTVLSQAVVRAMQQVRVVPLREQQHYRALLNAGSVRMLYQPIISLADGHLVKMEALARLCNDEGRDIAPNRFLPAFGLDDLLRLFELGLDQACADYKALAARGIRTAIAINCPAEGCGDARYENALSRILELHGVPREALDFEVLETADDSQTSTERSEFLHRLEATGVRIVQDDLGSGHSSLQRMDQHPFHEVKIDQSLVRGALRAPKKTVEFIFNLTRLAHAFDIRVTVEGLEYEGLVEAAAILGADHGQGFAIARPMTADQLAEWHAQYTYSVRPTQPRTAFGALAAYLLWDLQLATINDSPKQLSTFTGARALLESFIAARQLEGGPIDRLVQKIRSISIGGEAGDHVEPMTEARHQLVSELTAHCFSENA